MCSICATEQEDGYHAVMNCTKARALRDSVRLVWSLPPDAALRRTGPDWVLLLLSQVDEDCRSKLLFLWWRAWHLRNDVIFAKGDASVSASAQFLFGYANSLLSLKDKIKAPDLKGWVKLNVDASFIPASGLAA
ncbi:hypothetical protein BRADI_1g15868v3 [Brachypodium distachyon]|uniref:Reverse transcriptase zinc-binding domain-containing protein n=1 Tax=Brachypodium distachyon TaxID=15368 RepID=A0A0Q3GU34_BRADI|nr:hypothetical protein BRADI_1g15868v3 [Brachypodium distachyon]